VTQEDTVGASGAGGPAAGADAPFGLVQGTYEEGLTHVGRVSEVRFSSVEVNAAMIRQFVAAVEDPNPVYWEPRVAVELFGSELAPPATLVSWGTNLRWTPEDVPPPAPALLVDVPLPGDSMINVSSEIEFFDQIRVGDRLNLVEEVESISPEKQTAMGPGHFITLVARYRRQSGELVAVQRNVMLRHRTEGAT
jgi:acyl dehydratase